MPRSPGSKSKAGSLKGDAAPDAPQLILYGGKGGAGKTTCAAARALREAARRTVLLVSTDPAHSLGDALGKRLTARPRRVARRLDAAELDAGRAFARWLDRHRHAVASIFEHGTWLDRDDIDAILELPIPGVDELVGLLEIVSLASTRYDAVVVDTAPTGHTLRLVAAPDTVTAVTAVLDGLQEEHRIIRQRFAGAARPDAADRLIELMAREAADVASTLRDPRRTAFHWVTLPEALSVAESADAIGALSTAGIAVRDVIVNRVLPGGTPCPLCDPRRAAERTAIAAVIRRLGGGRRVHVVSAAVREPRGIAELRRLPIATATRVPGRPARRRVPADPLGHAAPLRLPESLPALRGASLLFVVGKGGVGKTTVAAALALRLAGAMPRAQVLLLSTDPAHSVGDVFDAEVGDAAVTVPGAPPNLAVREIDAVRAMTSKREAFQEAIDEAGAILGATSRETDRLMNLAPPGIDELVGMLAIVDALAAHRLVVVDTAPTGHALRLLEMPDAATEWVHVLLRVLLKYKSLARPGRLASQLLSVAQSMRTLQTVLRDRKRTRFIVVARAAALPRVETGRLVRRLRSSKLAVPAIVVNARTLTPGRCRRCRAVRRAEARELAALTRLAGAGARRDCAIIQSPLVAPPPRGAEALDRWAQTWTASTR